MIPLHKRRAIPKYKIYLNDRIAPADSKWVVMPEDYDCDCDEDGFFQCSGTMVGTGPTQEDAINHYMSQFEDD